MENDLSRKSLVAIGEKLKKARETKALAIDQVRKQTHIHSSIIIALEEGRCDEILTNTYVKSFLKKYSHYLGLNSDEIVREYLKLHPEEPGKTTIKLDSVESGGKDIFSKFIYVISVALLLIAFLTLVPFLGKKLIALFKKPKIVKTISLKKTSPMPIARALARHKATEKVEAPAQMSIPKKEPLNLILKVRQQVMVGVKKDGVVLFKRVMSKGASESFKADEKIEIYVAKAEAIELVLNGKSLGSPGKGVIKNLEITRKGMRIK